MNEVKDFAQKAGYIQTVTGRKVYIPNTDPDSIHHSDFAWALSCAPRFAGHLTKPMSVAEHSINVSSYAGFLAQSSERSDEEVALIKLQGLLHDATEAYLCDIPTPFKVMIPGYAEMEHALWEVIANKYGVPVEMYAEVKVADKVMLMSERDQYRDVTDNWGDLELIERVPLKPYPLLQSEAHQAFLLRFLDLRDEVNIYNNSKV
ncbi:metallophosphoesterase [Stenotrophomonas phage Moby]|uniref:Metallophosphoesterase n=1 Tax=Stenotrophomonas phage Moby TaxID=2601680 RepID=A0A5P8PME3_9CAUD|nr:deoxyribonucleoside 5' monophosphate phosphatase [Stenotrophomonas phage Moby]QFR57844.1 metallophosphoesterase [Stenotrophomonas phage Moby]